MQRRTFLGLTAASLTLSFDAVRLADERLPQARERALAAGKSLLALVVPEDEQGGHTNGRLIGRLLSHGADPDLAVLACCEVACIPAAELKALGELPDDAFVALIDPHLDPQLIGSVRRGELEVQLTPAGFDTASRMAARIGAALRALVMPDEETVYYRSRRCLHQVGEDYGIGLDFLDLAARPRLADVDRAAPMIYPHGPYAQEQSGQVWFARLADAAALRLWERAPEGSSWTEDPTPAMRPDPCPPCGMAVCPAPSRTFLDLYTR